MKGKEKRMNARPLYLALAFASLHAGANAQLFKCKGANDRVVFQDTPCAMGTTDANPRPKPAAREASVVLPDKDNKPGANWSLGPRPPPSRPPPPPPQLAEPAPAAPTRSPQQVSEEQRQRKQSDFERQQAAEQKKAEDDKAVAFNRMQRCNYARQQLGVANSGRPIYSYDNKGERHYVEDENRKAATTAAEQRVAQDCN
jgi:hypothetical protein